MVRIRRHPLVLYFALAYAITWTLAIPLALSARGLLSVDLPPALHYLTLYGPLVAAVGTEALIRGRPGMMDLLRRVVKVRIGWPWLLLALSPLVLYAVVSVSVRLATGAGVPIAGLGTINFLPPLGLAVLPFWILTAGLGEETGWRGFALPRLQARHSALTASLLLGALWAGWHVPFFFYLPGYVAMGLAGFPGFAMSLVAGAVVLTWIYNSTRGSVFATVLWHGTLNVGMASTAVPDAVAMGMSLLVIAWAIGLVVVLGPARLSRTPKQIIRRPDRSRAAEA